MKNKYLQSNFYSNRLISAPVQSLIPIRIHTIYFFTTYSFFSLQKKMILSEDIYYLGQRFGLDHKHWFEPQILLTQSINY